MCGSRKWTSWQKFRGLGQVRWSIWQPVGPYNIPHFIIIQTLWEVSFYHIVPFFVWSDKNYILKLVRQRNLSKIKIKTRYMSFSSIYYSHLIYSVYLFSLCITLKYFIRSNVTKLKVKDLAKLLSPGPNQRINLATCWALQFTSFYYTPNFVGSFLLLYRAIFCIIWKQVMFLKLVRQRNFSTIKTNNKKTRHMSFNSMH